MSAEVAYNRRWFKGNKVTDNTLRGPGDYEQFTIAGPAGSAAAWRRRLSDHAVDGDGGGRRRGAQNYVTFETDFGPERTQYWHGVDFTLNARLRQGLTLQVGTQTGRSIEDTCAIAQVLDSTSRRPTRLTNLATIKDLRNCRDVDPFQTTVRGLASYTLPKIDVLVSGTVRSQPALERVATWQVPNTVIQSIIGRLPPGGLATGNTTVDILDNDHRLYADNRRTQIDMRFAKILRFGSRRAGCRRGPRQPAEHQLRDDVREHLSVQRRQYGDGRHLEQPDGHLHAAVRPLEPDGRLLRCSVASARRRHLCSARTSRSRKSTAILVMKFAADYPGVSAPQCVGIVSSRFQHARERDIETGQKMAECGAKPRARLTYPPSGTRFLRCGERKKYVSSASGRGDARTGGGTTRSGRALPQERCT